MHRHLYPFERFPRNPILTREDIPYPCNTVFNAAACRFGDYYLLVLRVEDLEGHSHLAVARSQDGIHFEVDPEPWVVPADAPPFEVYERYGVEDPRITPIGDAYYLTYTAYGPYGPRVGIGRTRDFRSFERICLATEVDNKDAVLFPERIRDRYVMINRPGGMGGSRGSMWISYSPDLIHWGRARVLFSPEPGWGSHKLGVSTPPLRTDEGWLILYHGIRETAGGRLYRIGVMLLDLEEPERVVGVCPHFVFGPEEPYERTGDVPNVVFPCGWILEPDHTLKVYYGAADTCIGLAEARLEDLIRACLTGGKD